ncbi:MAG: sigma-70 family RNA polymerase sigma factor [Solobacterium sp.]|nr:sigma-70 family RNA polymerase sigma factor [Solobacterium sp.]
MDNSTLTNAYRHYYAPLYSYALFLTHNHAEAEDLVSEAFVKAILSWNGNGRLKPWLFRVLKNQFIDNTRKTKKLIEVSEEALLNLPDPRIEADNELETQLENQRWLSEKIQQMKLADQELMLLTLYSGMSDSEIASQLNISIQNLRVRRYRLKQELINAVKRGTSDE